MKKNSELKILIEEEIQNLEYPKIPHNLYKPIKYILNIGGKRMRPILMLMSHQLFDLDIHKSLKAAIGIEIFHNFTLLHDDIMDNSPLRRGVETVHEMWNSNIAILAGDTMFVQSYQYISDVDSLNLRDVLDVFNKAAKEVCEGQQSDMDFETRENVGIDEYIKMVEYKTAVLLAASLKIGAINGGASKKDTENLYEFGKNIGIAFQLKDDLLDIFGKPSTFGKQSGGDIMSNKKTYLYLRALKDANKEQYSELLKLFNNEKNSLQKLTAVKTIFTDLEISRKTSDLIQEYYYRALNFLEDISSENKQPLLDFSKLLIDRDY